MPELKPQRGGLVNVGAKARELQEQFHLFATARTELGKQPKTNRATPRNLKLLLTSLRKMTDELEQRLRDTMSPLTSIALDQIAVSLVRWNERLDGYIAAVDAAPPDDRRAVLWTVTAPLLVGYYGGETSTEAQRTLDAVTPWVIANQMKVDAQWQDERWQLLIQDLKDNAADVAGNLAEKLAIVAIAVGVVATAIALLTPRRR